MKKLLLKLAAITLLTTPVANIVSCSTGKSTADVTSTVNFAKSSFAVLKGESLSIDVTNYQKLKEKGFTFNYTAKTSDSKIASYTSPDSDSDPSSILIQGQSVGVATITITYANISTQQLAVGTFTIHVLDFSSTQIDWDGQSFGEAIDIYSSGAYVVFGKIKNFENFKNDDIGYDYTSGFSVSLTLTGDSTNLSNFIETDGTVDSQGQICFKLKSDSSSSSGMWNENTDGTSIQVNVSNKALGITDLHSDQMFVDNYGGGATVNAVTHDLNFYDVSESNQLIDDSDEKDSIFKDNGDGTYTIVYSLNCDVDGFNINSNDFDDASTIEMGNDNVALVGIEISNENEYSVTLKLTNTNPFSAFNISVYFVFNKKDTSNKDNEKIKYSGVVLQGFTDHLASIDGVNGKTIKNTKLATITDFQIDTSKYTPLDISTTLDSNNDVKNILSSGYSFSQWLAVGTSDPVLSKLNPDPKDPESDSRVSQSDIDSATDISKSTSIPFDINNISVENTNLEITGTGAIRTAAAKNIYVLLVYKDSNNNIIVGSVYISISKVAKIDYSSYIDTSNLSVENAIYDSSDSAPNKKPLTLHDGLSVGTGLEMHANDENISLSIGSVNGSKNDIDYSTWSVTSSKTWMLKPTANPISKDGTVSLIQVGQKTKDFTNDSIILTFTNPSSSTNTINITLYTSAFVGQETGLVDLSKYLINTNASITVSNTLRTTSLTSSKPINGVIEFNNDIDKLTYTASSKAMIELQNSPISTNINNYVVFDTEVSATTPYMINTGYYSGYTKKIVFNGDVSFRPQIVGSASGCYGSGILNTNVNSIKGYFSGGATFNGNVSVVTQEDASVDTSQYGVGVVSTGATSDLGDIFINGDVNVDVNWKYGAAAAGLLVAVKSYFSYYPEASNFTITANNVEISGTNVTTKALVDDYAGYIRTTDPINKTKITVADLTIGKSDVGASSSNGYGNSIYSRINGTGATDGDAGACLGVISIDNYYDLDAGEDANNDNASIMKIKGGLSLFTDQPGSAEMGIIDVKGKSRRMYQNILQQYITTSSRNQQTIPLVIAKYSDLWK